MDSAQLMIWVVTRIFYPLWLAAGLVDYICHRRTRIEDTSGAIESWLHLVQFLALGAAWSIACMLMPTPLTFALSAVAVAIHTAASFVDVSYTVGRRYISPLEQHVHGFLDVLPIVAVVLWGAANWPHLQTTGWALRWKGPIQPEQIALLASYFVLAGVPVGEELRRSSRKTV
jgi:hypothetical protein